MTEPSIYTPWDNGDTPAPWSVEDTDERVTVRDAVGGLIADCSNGFHDDDGDWQMSAACGPLAHLIAAAPELLEMVRVSIGNVRSLGPAGALGQTHAPYREWLAQLEAAYAKATAA